MGYLLCGQNSLLIEERTAALVSQHDTTGLGAETIDVQASSLEAITAACHSTPFFGGARVVVLRQPLAQSRGTDDESGEDGQSGRIRWPDLFAILKAAPPTSVIIVRHEGSLSPGHFARKALQGIGWAVEQFEIPRGADLLAWVSARAAQRDFSFAPGAAERLLDLLYPLSWSGESRYSTSTPDPRTIAGEIEKLSLAAVDGQVSVDTVEQLVEDRSGYRAFQLSEEIFRKGNVERALKELELMLAAGEPPERLVATLASDVVGYAHSRLVGPYAARDVASATGQSEGRVKVQAAVRFDRRTLQAMAETVRHYDSAVKTGHAPSASDTIAPLVTELASLARSSSRPRSR